MEKAAEDWFFGGTDDRLREIVKIAGFTSPIIDTEMVADGGTVAIAITFDNADTLIVSTNYDLEE